MIFGYFLLIVALSISAVAAFYSIAGLTAIFAAAVVPIIIMGAVLETGKIAATVWLHKYWHRAALQFKLYLVPAILILMLITSMGIFGYLSKAHLDQAIPMGDVAAQVSILDEKIKFERETIQTQKDNIAVARRTLAQLDSQVNETLARTSKATDNSAVNRSVTIRRQQAKERAGLQQEINLAQKEIETINARIAVLNEQRAPIAAEIRKVEAEVGPIKYIAALIYGDNPDATLLERAVRWVIILLVLVFDPLALVLILAAEQTFKWRKEDLNPSAFQVRGGVIVPTPAKKPAYEPDDGPLTKEQIQTIQRTANVDLANVTPISNLFDDEEESTKEFFQRGKEIARELDKSAAEQAYLKTPWAWIPSNTQPASEEIKTEQVVEIPQLLAQADNQEVAGSRADFGDQFPANPTKGDMFLRVDVIPSVLFKWNGYKWIEIGRTSTDRYANNLDYIKFAISKLESGEYSIDMLSPTEQDQVERVLSENRTK